MAAAQETGLPPKVVPWALGSHFCISSREATTAESGNPDAMAFGDGHYVGNDPGMLAANHFPVLPIPDCTSSKMSRMPYSSQIARRPCRYFLGAG